MTTSPDELPPLPPLGGSRPAVAEPAEVQPEVAPPAEASSRRGGPFDFGASLPLPPTAARLVERVQDVAPRIGLGLSVVCGRPVTVRCTGAARVSAVQLGPLTSTWCYADAGELGRAVLVVSPVLTVVLADTLMGGTGEVAGGQGVGDRPGDDKALTGAQPTGPATGVVVPRAGTALERRLVLRHLGPALAPLVVALEGDGLTELVAGDPQDGAPPSSLGDLVALRLAVKIDPAGVEELVTLALPARALLPATELVTAEPAAITAAALGEVPVELSLRLSSTAMSAADVESLSPGDVVRLDHHAAAPLLGMLDGRVVLLATLGRRGRRRAVLVTDMAGGS